MRASSVAAASGEVLQSEIAGKLITPSQQTPARGTLIRHFQLSSSEKKSILLLQYRGRSNRVLVFAGASEWTANRLSNLQRHQAELTQSEARVLVIFAGSQQRSSDLKRFLHLSFEVLAEQDEQVYRLLGATDPTGHIWPAVFITDRFGEVYCRI